MQTHLLPLPPSPETAEELTAFARDTFFAFLRENKFCSFSHSVNSDLRFMGLVLGAAAFAQLAVGGHDDDEQYRYAEPIDKIAINEVPVVVCNHCFFCFGVSGSAQR
jgi:hypothetical protein